MRRPERGALPPAVLLVAAAVLTAVVALGALGGTGVVPEASPRDGLVFVTPQELGALTSRRYAEGPAGAVTPPALLQANERDSAYGSSLVVEGAAPAAPPGAPLLLGVAVLLRRGSGLLLAAAAGLLGATTLLVGLTGGHVARLAAACLLALGGGLLRHMVENYATLLPLTVISDILGVPEADRAQVLSFGGGAAPSLDVGLSWVEFSHVDQSLRAFDAWLGTHLQRLREEPGTDLLSQLVVATDDGGRLTEDELRATAGLLLAAGFETTVNLLGSGTELLLRHPEQLARLRAEPALWANAVEEVLRHESPVQVTARVAVRDTVVQGVAVRNGNLLPGRRPGPHRGRGGPAGPVRAVPRPGARSRCAAPAHPGAARLGAAARPPGHARRVSRGALLVALALLLGGVGAGALAVLAVASAPGAEVVAAAPDEVVPAPSDRDILRAAAIGSRVSVERDAAGALIMVLPGSHDARTVEQVIPAPGGPPPGSAPLLGLGSGLLLLAAAVLLRRRAARIGLLVAAAVGCCGAVGLVSLLS